MRQLLAASLKMVLRDRQSVFWAIAFPMIFLGVFRLFSFDSMGTTELIVSTGAPPSTAQQALVGALTTSDFLEVRATTGLDADGAREAVAAGDANAVLLLEATATGEQARLFHGIRDPIGASVTEASIASIIDAVNLQLTGVPPAIAYRADSVEAERRTFFQFLGPGIIGMGLMTFATISLAASLARYREEGVLRRIRATPLAPWKFFGSVVAAHLVMACVQVIVLAVVAELLGARVLTGGILFLLVAVFGTVIFLNIGVIIAGRVRGRGAVEGAANAVTMPMMFLSGSFFPTDALPPLVQRAVEVLPLTHMLRVLRGLTEGTPILELWPSLLVMTLWVVGTAFLARLSFSLRDA